MSKPALTARQVLSDRSKWTAYYLARDAAGEVMGPADENAVCWCAMGAVYKACHSQGAPFGAPGKIFNVLDAIVAREVGDYNDDVNTRYEDIMRLFDIAAERLPADLAIYI